MFPFRSKLFWKAFLSILLGLLIWLPIFYWLTVPLVNRMAYEIEENAGRTVLENVVKMVTQSDHDLKAWRETAMAAHRRELKNIALVVESWANTLQADVEAGRLGKTAARERLLDRLRQFRYGNNDYVWAADYRYVMVSHPDPAFQNFDTSNWRDDKGNRVGPLLVDEARKNGEGYASYWWRRLQTGPELEKLSYCRNLPFWGLVVGTGVYIDDVDEEVRRRRSAIIADLRAHLHELRVARSGYVFVIDGNLDTIVHPDPLIEGTSMASLVDPGNGQSLGREFIEAARRPDKTVFYQWNRPDDPEHFSYPKVAWIHYVPEFNWYLGASAYTDELAISGHILATRLLLAFFFGLLITGCLAFLFIRQLTAPILHLAEAARRSQAGDLTVESNIDRDDEIGVLARAFDSMVARLKEQIETLEQRVDERTRELAAWAGQLEVRVAERTAEAEKLARQKSEFLAHMSHEIRTPLNAVLGFAQVGRRESEGRQAQKLFGHILDSSQLLLGIVDDILDYSKMEAGKLVLEQTTVPVGHILDRLRDLVAARATGKGLQFGIEEGPDLPATCVGDPLRLTQVLLNLLGNAIKFTERGSVTLAAAREGEQLVFRVRDSGIGMTRSQIGLLFQPFTQADASTTRRFGGTGLGLVICRRLVDLMGGSIEVHSMPTLGSTFEVRLPLVDPRGTLGPRLQSAVLFPIDPATGPRLLGLSILAADDNETNRLVLEEMLSGEGCRLVQVADGRKAVERVQADGPQAFDIVLMDIQMPEMDGYTATRHILELAPSLPVVGLTAHALAEERQKCLDAGMADHVAKPIELDALVDVILAHARGGGAGHVPHSASVPAAESSSLTDGQIDWPALVARFKGRHEFLTRLLSIALQQDADVPARLRTAAAAADWLEVRRLAHDLKSMAGNLVVPSLRELAARTEAAARGEEAGAADLARELADVLTVVLEEMQTRVDQAKQPA